MSCGVKSNGKPDSFINQWIDGYDNIRIYDDVDMYPTPLVCPNNIFNLWTPFKAERYIDSYTPNKEALDTVLNHIKILCGNEEPVFRYFCKWIAHMIQYPAEKSIAPILISEEGAGKGSLITLLENMLGSEKVLETTDPMRDVFGNFNNLMQDAFFVVFNEVGKTDMKARGKLKNLISDTRGLTINGKGINAFKMKSFHRFLISTNEENPVTTTKDDRRQLIIRCSDELCGNKEYGKAFNKLIREVDVIRTCYDYFKSMPDVDEFMETDIPKTEYQNNLKQLSLSAPEQFLMDFCSKNEGLVEVENKDFYNQLLDFIESNNIEYKTTPLKFGVKIANLRINGIEKGKHTKTADYRNIDIDKVKKHFNIIDPTENPFIEEEEEVKVNYYSGSALDCSIDFSN
jgi:hypothetical protein